MSDRHQVPPFLYLREKLIQSNDDKIRYENYRYRRQTASGQYTGNGRYEGFIMELLERIRSVIRGIDFEYEVELVPDGKYGAGSGWSKIWNGMVGEVVRGKADVAAGPLTVTGSRKSVVDFTYPFMSSGIQPLILHPNYVKHDPFRIIYPFSIEVWCLNFFIFCLVALMLFAFNCFDPYEWKLTAESNKTDEENADNFTLKNSLWFCASTLFLQSYHKSPRSNAGRCIAGFWWLFILTMVFLYIFNLQFFVNSQKRLALMEDSSDLKAQKTVKYGTVYKGNTYHYFKKTAAVKSFWHKMNNDHADVYVSSLKAGVERVRNSNGNYALLGESPILRYIASQKPCDVQVVGEYIARTQYAFAVAKDSPLREHLSSALEALRDNAVLEDLARDWWDLDDRRQRCHNLTVYERSGSYSLLVNDISGVYYILVIGIFASAIVFLAEMVFFKCFGGEKKTKRPKAAKQNNGFSGFGGGQGMRGNVGIDAKAVGGASGGAGGASGGAGGNMWI